MTKEQQQVFLDAAITMAAVDEHLDLDERAFLARVQREIGDAMADPQHLERSELISRTASAFDGSLIAARSFLIELAGLVTVDGDQSDAELALLHDLAHAARVPSSDVPLFLDFARRAVELADDARDLLAASNVDSS